MEAGAAADRAVDVQVVEEAPLAVEEAVRLVVRGVLPVVDGEVAQEALTDPAAHLVVGGGAARAAQITPLTVAGGAARAALEAHLAATGEADHATHLVDGGAATMIQKIPG